MTKPFLHIRQLAKSFGATKVLHDLSLDIHENEFVCLLGPSGCGKTTLLRIIAGLEQETSGAIMLEGSNLLAVAPAKRGIGIVFQSYALFPNLTVQQNVEFGLHQLKKAERRTQAQEVLQLVGLADYADRYPAQLSGGQQQRVALARAIALKPKFLLLDEPLSALDAKVREKLRHEIRQLQQRIGITTIMVTHDQEEALTMADKIVVMNEGRIMQIGTPEEVYHEPANPFVAEFIGAINFWQQPGFPALHAVRPENITLSRTTGLKAIVNDIEFRGAVYRVELHVIEQTSSLFNQVVKADVLATVMQQLHISVGETVHIQVPAQQLIEYEVQVTS